ncbi:prephenate dehydratase, partial [Neophaeococcomyces mojaviensis]
MTTTQTFSKQARTAYLGPEASFSHQAVVEALPQSEPVPLPSFGAILQALQESGSSSGGYDYAVLPVENSTNGSVVQALDLLAKCGLDPETSQYNDVEVVDEHYLEVHHCLFVSRAWAEQRLEQETLEYIQHHNGISELTNLNEVLQQLNIKTLYSHPQVWGQCNNFLSALLPPGRVERVDMSSTSAAAAFVAGTHKPQKSTTNSPPITNEATESHPAGPSLEEPCGTAAISSALAGEKHSTDLLCIAQNIEDEPGTNTTR